MDKDKFVELHRYDARAQLQLSAFQEGSVADMFGSNTMSLYLRAPYIYYERQVADLIKPHHRVLELGAGTGVHTWALIQTGAQVTATDISPVSLNLLKQRINSAGGDVATQVADMESLPFKDRSFDVVTCAGSLSYGEPALVDAEIKRVLRHGGSLICVDSLNNNPIYRFNRWLQCRRGSRTRSTYQRIPDYVRIHELSRLFMSDDVCYFGTITFVMPLVARMFGQHHARIFSDFIDRIFGVRCSAFKFVLVARDLQKGNLII